MYLFLVIIVVFVFLISISVLLPYVPYENKTSHGLNLIVNNVSLIDSGYLYVPDSVVFSCSLGRVLISGHFLVSRGADWGEWRRIIDRKEIYIDERYLSKDKITSLLIDEKPQSREVATAFIEKYFHRLEKAYEVAHKKSCLEKSIERQKKGEKRTEQKQIEKVHLRAISEKEEEEKKEREKCAHKTLVEKGL